MAPEVLRGSYDLKCDIWSCGILMYLLISEEIPFPVPEDPTKMASVLSKFNPEMEVAKLEGLSIQARDFLTKILLKSPKSRLSAKEALAHPWFKECMHIENLTPDVEVLTNFKNFHVSN